MLFTVSLLWEYEIVLTVIGFVFLIEILCIDQTTCPCFYTLAWKEPNQLEKRQLPPPTTLSLCIALVFALAVYLV
jgi:hypothetical protein